jgi:hypothetical protein
MPNPKSTASIAGHPIHPMVIPFPIAFLVTAFVTDPPLGRAVIAPGRSPQCGSSALQL